MHLLSAWTSYLCHWAGLGGCAHGVVGCAAWLQRVVGVVTMWRWLPAVNSWEAPIPDWWQGRGVMHTVQHMCATPGRMSAPPREEPVGWLAVLLAVLLGTEQAPVA